MNRRYRACLRRNAGCAAGDIVFNRVAGDSDSDDKVFLQPVSEQYTAHRAAVSR